MTRARTSVVAKYPPGPLLIFLLILLVGDYLCIDLRFFHYIEFSRGVTSNSPWFWVIFAGLMLLTFYCVKQIFFPSILLKANLSGLELGHRALRPKVCIPWEDVDEISLGRMEFSSQNGRGVMPALRLVVKTSANLGGVISNMTQAEGGTVSFAASLFEDDLETTVGALQEICAHALGEKT